MKDVQLNQFMLRLAQWLMNNGVKRGEYIVAVQAGMNRDYMPMERIFNGVIEWTLAACGR